MIYSVFNLCESVAKKLFVNHQQRKILDQHSVFSVSPWCNSSVLMRLKVWRVWPDISVGSGQAVLRFMGLMTHTAVGGFLQAVGAARFTFCGGLSRFPQFRRLFVPALRITVWSFIEV